METLGQRTLKSTKVPGPPAVTHKFPSAAAAPEQLDKPPEPRSYFLDPDGTTFVSILYPQLTPGFDNGSVHLDKWI